MDVEIWSDVVCPWCYIGKRRFETAVRTDPAATDVEVHFRSYELDPSAARNTDETLEARIARRYGWGPAQVAQANAQVTRVAEAEGLEYHLDLARPSNTFDAHRLLHLAGRLGRRPIVEERFFRGYFTEGAWIGDAETLAGLAVEAGLPETDVRRVLAGEEFSAEVRADEEAAREFGARGVPFFVFDRRFAVSGAQPAEVFREALERARSPTPVDPDPTT